MEITTHETALLRQYLLGNLTDGRREQVEELLLTDDDFYEELGVVEDELIDEYLRGEISGGGRERFESHFLVPPERRRKLDVARALRAYVAENPPPEIVTEVGAWWRKLLRPFRVPSLAAALPALLILVAGSLGILWLTRWREEDRGPIAQTVPATPLSTPLSTPPAAPPVTRESPPPPPSVGTTQDAPSPSPARGGTNVEGLPPAVKPRANSGGDSRPPAHTFAAALVPNLTRDAATPNELTVPERTTRLRLTLGLLDNAHSSYRASLLSGDKVILTRTKLKARPTSVGHGVVLDAPAELLTTGEYEVRLDGATRGGNFENVGRYFLTVKRNRPQPPAPTRDPSGAAERFGLSSLSTARSSAAVQYSRPAAAAPREILFPIAT